MEEQLKSSERNSLNYGPIHRMYESTHALVIVIPSNKDYYEHIALQIAHDWYLYGRGDSIIITTDEEKSTITTNGGYRIYLGLPTDNKLIESIVSDKPCGIEFEKSCTSVTGIKVGDKLYDEPGTGQ